MGSPGADASDLVLLFSARKRGVRELRNQMFVLRPILRFTF